MSSSNEPQFRMTTSTPASGSSSIQLKERKNGLSCAECRRSKLKCDRSIPCQACVRRGCPSICPDGTLNATKGNKALQERNQKLTEQVKTLGERIAELEAELIDAKRQPKADPPASYPPNTDREPNDADVSSQLVDAIGNLAINDEGVARYYGSTSSSEYLSSLLPNDGMDNLVDGLRDRTHLGFPPEILHLVYAFPFGMRDYRPSPYIFLPFIPLVNKAQEYTDLYYENVAWMFDSILRADYDKEIFNAIYGNGVIDVSRIHAHRLSVFFSVIALGVGFTREPDKRDTQERFHALACASISMEPIARGVTCSTVHAFFLIMRFLNSSVRTAAEDCWLLFGLTVRIAQTVGIHCDGSMWNLEKEELQRRRVMFWELFTWDCWNAFVMGRPPAMQLEYSDCKYPDNDVTYRFPEDQLGFHAWKFRYTAACLPWTLKQAFSPSGVSYDALKELDKRIRTFPVPEHLYSPLQGGGGRPWSADAATAMRQYNCIYIKETNLLYLHRSYFAIAVHSEPSNPLSHKYGASVMAAYRSACRQCFALGGVHMVHPGALGRIWLFWSGIFSSCVILAALVLGSPGCSLAGDALMELNSASTFYEEGSAQCRPPKSILILEKLKHRAREAYAAYHATPEANRTATPKSTDEVDELSVLGGIHGVIRHNSESPGHSPAIASETSHIPSSLQSSGSITYAESSIRTGLSPPAQASMAMEEMQPTTSWMSPSNFSASYEGDIMNGMPSGPVTGYHESFYPQILPSPYEPQINTNSISQTSMQQLRQIGPLDFYDNNFLGVDLSMDPEASHRLQNGLSTGGSNSSEDYNRQNTWTSFIEGLMNDTNLQL